MHVLLPPPPDWEASSVFLTAVNGSFGKPFPSPFCRICFPGCRHRHPCRATSRPGSSLHSVLLCLLYTCSWATATFLFTAFSAATTLPLSPAAGRVSLWPPVCSVLRSFFLLQQRCRISVHIDHVPGIVNDTADALSRSTDPAKMGFKPDEEVQIDWLSFTDAPHLSLFPDSSPFEGLLASGSSSSS